MWVKKYLVVAVLYLVNGACNTVMAQEIERLVLTGGTIIDVRNGTLLPNSTIVIEGERIVSISEGTITAQPNDQTLDISGQFVIPGLIDAHLHYEEFAAELLLNHGVTTAVDLGNDYEWIKAQVDAIEAGIVPGPRLYYSTPHFDASPPAGNPLLLQRGHKHFLDDAEAAREATQLYVADGASAVKIYERLTPEVMSAIAQEADRANIPVIGHFLDAETAARVGNSGIEHLRAVAQSAQDEVAVAEMRAVMARNPGSLGLTNVATVDWEKLPTVFDMMIENNVYLNPTLMIYRSVPHFREKGFPNEDFDLLINDWRLRYIPLQFRLHILKEYQEQGVWHWNDLNEEEQAWAIRQFDNALRMTKMFADMGGKVYAGPDCAAACTFGLGLHQEIELLVDAGLTTLHALQSATLYSAEIMRFEDELGLVEENMLADIVVLERSPLEDIRATRDIAHVISRGKLIETEYHPTFHNPYVKPEPETSGHYFPSPRIAWMSPEALAAGSDSARLILKGSGFIPYSLINFGGINLETDYFGATHIEADVPAHLMREGSYDVTVENPDFAFGTTDDAEAEDLFHLGIRPRISNVFRILVRSEGAQIIPHPNEGAHLTP